MTDAPGKVTLAFTESSEEIINPERGFYVGLDLLSPTKAAQLRAAGHTLAIALVRLDDYRDKELDAALLDSLDRGFAAARDAGIKVILRFTYNSSFAEDASKARILGHVGQLAPLLRDNADVIAVMQAGFIGAWGEWHSSTNGLDNDADRGAILKAILDALPESRSVQVRTPMYKAGIFGADALSETEAWNGSERARVGHHNDCFLASDSDLGTYASPISQWTSFVAQEGQFTPIGGETCAVSARSNCETALAEMDKHHWSYLNLEYNQEVLADWDEQGCTAEVRRRLGYRFSLRRVEHDEVVAPGGVLHLAVDVANSGFASPINLRPVYVVLSGAGTRQVVKLDGVDARRWSAGETSQLAVKLRLPASLAKGTYSLALWLPDDAPGLRDDARFAIQLANDGVWSSDTGENRLSDQLRVDPAAPGEVDASADALTVLP